MDTDIQFLITAGIYLLTTTIQMYNLFAKHFYKKANHDSSYKTFLEISENYGTKTSKEVAEF